VDPFLNFSDANSSHPECTWYFRLNAGIYSPMCKKIVISSDMRERLTGLSTNPPKRRFGGKIRTSRHIDMKTNNIIIQSRPNVIFPCETESAKPFDPEEKSDRKMRLIARSKEIIFGLRDARRAAPPLRA
jgi:hypothetical protein